MATSPAIDSSCMFEDGPIDERFQIPGGALKYHPKRDARLPYIYEINTHALVHSHKHITTILIHVVNTSIEARIAHAKYVKTLLIPLGPNVTMDNYCPFQNITLFGYLITFLLRRSIRTGTGFNIICPATYGRRRIS